MSDFLTRYANEPPDGKYRLIEQLGAGGMGEVFKAEHVLLHAIRVIKIVRPQISGSADARERFLREARLATRVQHVNVAALYDFAGMSDGMYYMVWEFIDGENVAQLLRRRGPLPPHEAVRLAIQALHGLDAIHRAGIVHRDISPENLMVTRDGTVKIIDLGVAKGGDADLAERSMTRAGVFIGKLRYASPEHFGILPEGERIDGRADLYSLGLTLFEMLAGRRPLEVTSPHEYVIRHSQEGGAPVPDLSAIPEPLRPVIARSLQNDRRQRFATAAEFAAALERVQLVDDAVTQVVTFDTVASSEAPTQITPMPAAPRGSGALRMFAIALVTLIAVAAVVFFVLRRSSEPPAPAASTVAAPQTAAPTPAQSTMAVTASQPAIETTSSATSAPAMQQAQTETSAPAPAAAAEPEAQTQTRSEVRATRAETTAAATYFDGRGDNSHNSEAVETAKRALSGVTSVAVRGKGDPDLLAQLANILRNDGLTVADSAAVLIDFHGSVERQRFGRKRRSATATIAKSGRVVFRYELPEEEYRVGDNPAEAFARVAADLFR